MKKFEIKINEARMGKYISGYVLDLTLNTPRWNDDEIINAWGIDPEGNEELVEMYGRTTNHNFCEYMPAGVEVVASYQLRILTMNPFLTFEEMTAAYKNGLSPEQKKRIEEILTNYYHFAMVNAKQECDKEAKEG